ncbi:hypothetical protein [Streptomyces sp. R33]|uniref:Superfamily III holin-X n=1 Tax=Streptomyces sp. R33 TaxID=3238629 RepID=A0AB39YHM8_9ACTN
MAKDKGHKPSQGGDPQEPIFEVGERRGPYPEIVDHFKEPHSIEIRGGSDGLEVILKAHPFAPASIAVTFLILTVGGLKGGDWVAGLMNGIGPHWVAPVCGLVTGVGVLFLGLGVVRRSLDRIFGGARDEGRHRADET